MGETDAPEEVQRVLEMLRRGDEGAGTAAYCLDAQVYAAGLPFLCEFFASYDPRVSAGRKGAEPVDINIIFMRYVQMAHETPELAQVMVPALCDVVEWWADLLAETNGELEQVATPAQNLLNSWSMLAMSDSSFAEKILPCVLACLASKNENLVQSASSIVSVVTMSNKDIVADKLDLVLEVLDKGVSDMIATTLLGAVYSVYERNRDIVHRYVDTIAEYTVTGAMSRSTGSQVLSKIAKRAPRMLYGFVDELIPLLNDQRSSYMTLSTLADLSARNALLVRPHLNKIARASEDSTGGLYYGAPAVGRIGRVDPESAVTAQSILVGWLRDDIDPQATSVILAEVRNVGGVYKESLTPHMDAIRGMSGNGDSQVTDIVKAIVTYYDGSAPYLQEAFLSNQEDIFGRVLKLVDDAVEASTAGLKKSVEELSRRADNQEALLSSQREEVALLATDVERIGDRVNVMEVAAKQLESRVETVEASVEELETMMESQATEMKEFIANVVKKLPVPYAFEAKGRIRKRMILKFKCSRGSEPDFVYETAAWSKWLRVGLCALSAGKSVVMGDVMGTLKDFQKMYEAMKRKDIDAALTFKTLVEEPFLTSSEEDELLTNLRKKGFFKAFEYDAETATWYRKQAVLPPEPELETVLQAEAEAEDEDEEKTDEEPTTDSDSPASAAQQAEPEKPQGHSSWMIKVGQLFPTRRRRWFVLKDKTISYYENESLAVKKGEFPVRTIISISPLGADNWFTVTTHPSVHRGQYRLRVASEADYADWVGAIRRAQNS